ncbi:hypothetical protein [Priestia megaterium]|uniref:hypothetical protein n=1 Tax=Priestia megaterium TaxID=1404 RepID=UPI0014031872|nr:hypothetical protein [Priestia megaterium]
MKNPGCYTGSLFVRELERLKGEHVQLELEDMKEDIVLLEKVMDMLYKNKVY